MGASEVPGGPHGVAVVDKPAGWTSHDVVAKARGLLGTRKVGHAGTLDPEATGVLVLGVGRATRLLRYVGGLDKTYAAEVVLGVATTTLDAAGEVTATHDMSGVTVDDVRRVAIERFTGEVLQVAPMVSARKVRGRRLHELAREGIEVDREARPVTVRRIDVEPTPDPGVVRVEVECSSGTYVRSLAADIGATLGGSAHLRALKRTAVGSFTLAGAVPLTKLSPAHVLPPAAAVAHLAAVEVGADLAVAVGHGKVLANETLAASGPGPWAVVDAAGTLLAVYEPHRPGTVKPAVVLAPTSR